MEETSNNFSNNNSNKIKIKKKYLDFPMFTSNEELRYLKKKIKNIFKNIEETHSYLQRYKLVKKGEEDIPYKYFNELERLNNIERNKEKNKNAKIMSKIFNKKSVNKKRKNLGVLSLIEKQDLIPHQKSYSQRRHKTNYHKLNTSKNKYIECSENNIPLNQKHEISNLYMNNINYNINNSEKEINNEENIFLTSNKKKYNRFNSKSSKILTEWRNFNHTPQNESNENLNNNN